MHCLSMIRGVDVPVDAVITPSWRHGERDMSTCGYDLEAGEFLSRHPPFQLWEQRRPKQGALRSYAGNAGSR